jgi:hypothetical protein
METRLSIFGGGWMPCLRAAAFVMRGATTGGAVEATAMEVERLWPGTSMKACFCCSLVGITFGPLGEVLTTMPARRAAALVVRGAISGTRVVAGRGLARKTGLPLAVRWPELRPAVEGLVTEEPAYPSDVLRWRLDMTEEAREPEGN